MKHLPAAINLLVITLWISASVAWAQGDPSTGAAIPDQDDTVTQDADPALRRQAGIDPTLVYRENVQLKVSQVEINDFPTVRAFVSVSDESGYEITTLQEQHFTVTENGEAVENLRFSTRDELNLPLVVVFVVDISGSMGAELDDNGTTPLDLEIRAIKQFVEQLNPRDIVGLISFSDSPSREAQLTDDKNLLLRETDRMTAFGQTTLWDGIYRGMQEILSVDYPSRRAIIVLSDGEDNASMETPRTILDYYDKEAKQKNQPFTVYSIGLGLNINRRGLGDIATRTGGLYLDSPRADDLENLYQDILRQLDREYLLEYDAPVASKPGDIIDLEVGLNIVKSFAPGAYTYRSPGLAEALARVIWPGLILIAGLLVVLILATIYKMSRRVWLTVMVTSLEGKDYPIGELGANIGTSEVCEVLIRNDPSILPLHATIKETHDGFVIEASDPDSPIFSDGKALIRKLLRNRDRVAVGHTSLVFHERVDRPGESMELSVADVVDSRPNQITEQDQLATEQTGQPAERNIPVALLSQSGPYNGTRFELSDGANTLGRGADCTVSLPDDNQVSRNHCQIVLTGGIATIEDLGSSNGTRLNGKVCQRGLKQTIYAGDLLKIGSSDYQLK